MMVNGDAGAVFLGHTRAGSRDTYRELEGWEFRLVGKRHWSPRDLRRMAAVWDGPTPIRNLDWWERIGGWDRQWRFFSTVRDPYEFLLSHYCWNPLGGKHPLTEQVSVEWLAGLTARFPRYFPRRGMLWRFLHNPGCWRVMRLERLEDDLICVLRDLGLTGALTHLPKRMREDPLETRTLNKPPGPARRWFTPEAVRWIEKEFADEMRLVERSLQWTQGK